MDKIIKFYQIELIKINSYNRIFIRQGQTFLRHQWEILKIIIINYIVLVLPTTILFKKCILRYKMKIIWILLGHKWKILKIIIINYKVLVLPMTTLSKKCIIKYTMIILWILKWTQKQILKSLIEQEFQIKSIWAISKLWIRCLINIKEYKILNRNSTETIQAR